MAILDDAAADEFGTDQRQQMRVAPVRRGALAVEQSGAAKQKCARADAGYPLGVRRLTRDEIDRRGIAERVGNAVAAGNAKDIGLPARPASRWDPIFSASYEAPPT